MEYVLGIDLGTSSVKAGLLNLATLRLDWISRGDYKDIPEQDPEILWGQTLAVAQDLISRASHHGQVRAIGLTGQMHGAALYGVDGDLIGPLITWKDRKWSNGEVMGKIKRAMGERSFDELGTEISSGYSGAILYGIKVYDPDLFARIANFALPTDFLRSRLLGTNDYATDQTNAFGTGLFDTQLNFWHAELIRILELPPEIFPQVHATGEIAGTISADFARAVGLPPDIPVIYGGGDNQVGMLGCGLSGPGAPILLNIGTGAQISSVVAEFRRYPGLDTRSYFSGEFALVGAGLGGGGSYAWLRDEIREQAGRDLTYSHLDELAAGIPPGACGLMFCPGPTRRAPQRRRGFFGNLALGNSTAHRARAVLEGVLMEMYDSYEILAADYMNDFILGAGKGLQQSRLWAQIATDLLGRQVRLIAYESAALGSALLAAQGIGAVGDLPASAGALEPPPETAPDPEAVGFYSEKFVDSWRVAVDRQ